MKMFNVFYFYYYLFYKSILKDEQPLFTTMFTFSFSISLLINGIVNIVLAHAFSKYLSEWGMISVFVAVLALSYFYYYKKDKATDIIKNKPKFFNSNMVSILLTILFFVLTSSFLFWEPIYSKGIIDGK